jgi:RHS repeat-associated protein
LHDDGSDRTDYVEEQHYYQGGRTSLEGRGFLGFQRHAVRNTLSGETVDRRFDNTTYDPATHSYPLAGVPRAVMRYAIDLDAEDRGDTQFVGSKETFERELAVTPEGTHYTVLTSAVTRTFEENLVPVPVIFGGDPFVGLSPLQEVRRAAAHDDFGNTTSVVERITGVAGLSRTDATFINDTAQWRIGLPESTVSQTVESGECSLFERTTYGVDVALAEIVSVTRTGRVADPTIDRTTSVTRDARGNIDSLTMATTLPSAPTRTVTLAYEPTGYFVESVTNALGHRTDVSVEPRFGQAHHEVDPNGVETARSFDGFGRLRREESAGRGGVEVTYDLANELGRHQVRLEPDGGGRDVVEYDRLGRAVESQVEHAFVTSYAARRFDRLGRLALETEPFANPALLADPEIAPHTRMEHDDMGRLLSTLSAGGVRTEYRYPRNVREVQTDGAGEYVTELDPAGRVRAVEEPSSTGGAGGRTTYQYCRSGLLRRSFDPAGNATTVAYDDLGRRTFLDDPAAGVARFSYDAFDGLVRTEDALGRVNRWERDVLRRVEALHHDAEGITDRFFYDTAPRGTSGATVLGALASTESGDGVIDTYEYDGLARSIGQSRLVDGRLLHVSSSLDDLGRVVSTTYPDALGLGAVVLSTNYDPASGQPLVVNLDGTALWELRDQDARGAPREERLGSGSWGVIDRLSEYTAGGRLESLTSIAGATVLQDLHYDYSTRGLLEQRDDGVAGRTETFEHDALSRLTEVREAGVVRETYGVDAIGNLVSTHEGSVLYEDPSRPYAATEARGETVEYDDAGNAFHVGELTLTYTQRNLPRTVSSSKTGLVQYRYDAGGGRATKRSRDTDITYFGAYQLERRGMLLYERIALSTPAGVVAQLERANGVPAQGGTSRLRWLLSERQGSVETTWVNGAAAEHHRYDAYGGVLDAGGTATGDRPSTTVSAGYTGHEHEDDLGLVNMGGRVYSPTLRRFLTADPVVANPFGQGLNAYSYVRGNPLNATDPFGWQERPRDGTLGTPGHPHQLPEMLIHGRRITAVPPSGDQPQSESSGAGASGGASASGARGLANPSTDAARLLADPRGGEVRNVYGFNSDEMAAAAQQVQRSLDGADRFAHAVTYVGGAALGSFAAIELAAGGVMQGALAAEETSVGASQVINVATQIAEGIVADVGGGGVAVPSLVGAGGVGVRMAGQVGDDISRATSRASAVATTGGGGPGGRAFEIALGLDAGLENFARALGATPYWFWRQAATFQSRFANAVRNASRIHFNLSGFSLERAARTAPNWSESGGNLTSTEFRFFMDPANAQALQRVTFYEGGVVVQTADVLARWRAALSASGQ